VSQGQRFRRRALRRGYKVDEVDSFLDRVESTLAGDPMGAPVSAQEVHDVVFRVRFGGYDEWQVDLHLDRVERQLSELEERSGGFPRMAPDRVQPDMRMAPPPERMAPDRMAPERIPPDRMGPDRMPPPVERMGPPGPPMPPPPLPPRPGPMPVQPGPPPRDPGYNRYDEPTYGGAFDEGGYDPSSRHVRGDMTTEIRMDRGPEPAPYGGGGDPYGGPPPAPQSTEVARIDQLRRTFQLRRFGSGYDRGQVDRLFEGVVASLSGRAGPVNDGELDPAQFDLVPGGYFEAEVDAALKEVRDILMRRR
jgi:DivIVA domain-containing protein